MFAILRSTTCVHKWSLEHIEILAGVDMVTLTGNIRGSSIATGILVWRINVQLYNCKVLGELGAMDLMGIPFEIT